MLTASVIAVLAAAAWWWVTWPERTARDYDERIREWHINDRAALMAYPRTSADVLFGRRKFLTPRPRTLIEAERGNVRQLEFVEPVRDDLLKRFQRLTEQ